MEVDLLRLELWLLEAWHNVLVLEFLSSTTVCAGQNAAVEPGLTDSRTDRTVFPVGSGVPGSPGI